MSTTTGKAEGSSPGGVPRAEATSQLAPITGAARTFGKYRLLAELARGGMSDVHLAVSVGPAGFSKLQVIKRLRPGMTDIEEMRSMMLDEARLAARLNHKNIVQTNEVGIVDEQYFLAMEYLDGQPLHRIFKRSAQLGRTVPLPFAVKILCEVLSGLHYAHEVKDYDGHPLGVVHRDVSPQNVFVTYDGQVKVVDFGIAKAARRLVETQTGIIRGKITYMAPEQAFANEVDRRADIFSVGVMLWEAVAGERMWGQLSDPEIVARLMHDIPRVTTVRPDAPESLADLCAHALARSPERRPATAGEMRAELEEYLLTHDIQVTAEALGSLVADLFSAERADLQTLVDRELALLRVEGEAEFNEVSAPRMRTSETSGMRKNLVPAASIPGSPGVPTGRIPGSPGIPTARGSDPRRSDPNRSPAPPDSLSTPTVPHAPAFDQDESSTARELSPPVAVLSTPPPAPPPSSVTFPSATATWASRPTGRSPLVYVGAALAALALAGLLASKLTTPAGPAPSSSPEAAATAAATAPDTAPATAPLPPASTSIAASTSTAPAPTASASAAAPAVQAGYMMLRVTTNPVQSRILFDGAPLPAGKSPFELKFPKDGAVHRITIEAGGFQPQTRMLVFDRDQTLTVFLPRKSSSVKDSPY
ncbi:MAG: protein kinase [Polyangiaceae bacterium]